MKDLFGIELDNPTANNVVVNLFQLGANASSEIVNGVLAESETETYQISIGTGSFIFYFNGDTTDIDNNPNTLFNVSASNVFLENSTATPSPSALRQIDYSDGATNLVLSSQTIPPVSLSDWTNAMESLFETKVGESDCISINAIPLIQYNGFTYLISIKYDINYLRSESYILNTPTFTPIQNIRLNNSTFTSTITLPINGFSGLPNNWNSSFSTINGIVVKGTTGDNYGEILRSQVGNPMAINSMRITPLASSNYDLSSRISQLLQPIKFTRVDSNGLSDSYVLSPTVDLYQAMTTLDYLNLGTRTDDFPLDGNTIFSYELLPFARVNIQFDFVEMSNFIFANRKLIEEVVKLNKENNKRVKYLSGISREYKLEIK